MKKILFVLLLHTMLFATQQNLSQITGATIGSTDSINASGNFSFDSSASFGKFRMPSGQNYTLSKTAGKYMTLNNDGLFFVDSTTGIKTYPDSIIMKGSGRLKLSSGSGAIDATTSNLRVSGTKDTLEINKGSTVFKSLTIDAGKLFCVSSSAVGWILSGTTTPLILGTTATYTESAIAVTIKPAASISAWSIGAGSTINGTGGFIIAPTVTGLTIDIPAMTYTGNGYFQFDDRGASISATFNMSGHFTGTSISASNFFRFTKLGSSELLIFNTNNYNINIGSGIFDFYGASSVTNLATFNAGSSTITAGKYVPTDLARVATLNMNSSTWNISGNWTNWNTGVGTVDAGTSTVNITNTSTITHAGKPFYNLVINAATKTITTVGNQLCKGNFTVTAGKFAFASAARDSIYGDYINALPGGVGADSLNRNQDSLWLGGSLTTAGAVKNDMSRSYLYGTGLCNFTTNGAIVNYFDIRGTNRTKQMKLIDRLHIRKLLITTGTLNTNGQDCFADSFITINDSIATVLGDTISAPKITFGASAKPIIGTPMLLYFGLALADTLRDSIAQSLGQVVVNKSANGLIQSGKSTYTILRITDGTFSQLAATDTTWCDSLVWASTDSSTLLAPVIVSTGITVAAGCKIGKAATGSIAMTTCTQATLNGNPVVITYPAGCGGGSATSNRWHSRQNINGLIISP